jgi:hypothetical protein
MSRAQSENVPEPSTPSENVLRVELWNNIGLNIYPLKNFLLEKSALTKLY